MGFIYKITNDINNKIYIGLTTYDDPMLRWKKHINNHKIEGKISKRPLYNAMNKYGVEHFQFSIIEKVDEFDELCNREIYWINKLRTYVGFNDCNGYNATLGGETGNTILFYEPEISKIKHLVSIGLTKNKIAKAMGCHGDIITNELSKLNLITKSAGMKVCQINMEKHELLNIFDSCHQAAKSVFDDESKNSHIAEACKRKRKSAYGYFWLFYDDYILMTKNQIDNYCNALSKRKKRKRKHDNPLIYT